MQNLDYLATDAELRGVMNVLRIAFRSVVIGAMVAYTVYISTGLFLKATVLGLAFAIVSSFSSLRRWLEGPVVLFFILATIHWCDAGRFSVIPRLASYVGFAQ